MLRSSKHEVKRRIAHARATGATYLDLRELRIRQLPNSIGDLSNLTSLALGNNQLTSLPDSIGKLASLTTLDLGGNQLTMLPIAIGKLSSLGWLSLGGNQLATLPEAIGELTSLSWLSLGGNQLTALPDAIGNLASLTWLDLTGNQLTTLPRTIGRLARLTTLGIRSNRLTTLPESIGDLAELSVLSLRSNHLTALPDSIGNMTGLTNLGLRGNRLAELPDTIGKLANLTSLDLTGNQITALPETITNLANLTDLYLDDNPLASPPAAVIAEGSSAVLAFLREGGGRRGVPQWRSKLLVVGQGGAGKTSLVNALAGGPHDPSEPSTHGLRTSSLPVAHPSVPGVDMDLSVWDFGGQEIYHATHQFFLTDQALFVLVWNAVAGWEHGRLRYWLDLITARAPEAPVLLVATHTAARGADFPVDGLRRAYPQIRGSFLVDNATGAGVAELREELAHHAARLPLMGQPWPPSWLAAVDASRVAGRDHVTRTEFDALLARAGVREMESRRVLTGVLHQLGEILHYADDPGLADTVVLRPHWLNTRISRILDCESVGTRGGLLTRSDVAREWADIDPSLREHFLQMMDRFDVSYRVRDPRDDAVAVVVDRLNWVPPAYQQRWDQALAVSGAAQVRVRYSLAGAMPPGIPTWFIARAHRFSTGLHWRTGALLAHTDGEHLGLVTTDLDRGEVELAVRGPLPAAFLSILDDGLNVTFARYPGLQVTRWVPCNCTVGEGCPAVYDHARLLARLKAARGTVECDESFLQVDIPKLLFGLTPPMRQPGVPANEVMGQLAQRLDEVYHGVIAQPELLQREFSRLYTLMTRGQQVRCPRVFTLIPLPRHIPGVARYRLRLYCEEPGAWHPLPGDQGCYPIRKPEPWLARAQPYLTGIVKILKHAVPLAGPVLGLTAEELRDRLTNDLDLMNELLSQASDWSDRVDNSVDFDPSTGAGPRSWVTSEADLRAIAHLLDGLDPAQRWGGLSRVATPEGPVYYLCPQHAAAYREPATMPAGAGVLH